jgi:hypothetical protein
LKEKLRRDFIIDLLFLASSEIHFLPKHHQPENALEDCGSNGTSIKIYKFLILSQTPSTA